MSLRDHSTLEAQWPLRELDTLSARVYLLPPLRKERTMAKSSSRSSGKPSKASLSKAGRTLASNSSSKPAKSKAGSTLGKG